VTGKLTRGNAAVAGWLCAPLPHHVRVSIPAATKRRLCWCEDVFTQRDMVWPGHGAYLAACDGAFQQLRRKSEIIEFTAEVPTVVAVVRDEARRLSICLRIDLVVRRVGLVSGPP
jgi:hypothetical protein